MNLCKNKIFPDFKTVLTPEHTKVSCVFKYLAPANITHLIFFLCVCVIPERSRHKAKRNAWLQRRTAGNRRGNWAGTALPKSLMSIKTREDKKTASSVKHDLLVQRITINIQKSDDVSACTVEKRAVNMS